MRALVLLLAACNLDSKLTAKDDDVVGFDSGTDSVPVDTDVTDTAAPEVCPDRAFPGGPVTPLESCPAQPPAPFDAVIEWTNRDVGEMLATPIVGHLTDDDGDGVPGSAGDVPDIVAVNVQGDVYALSGDDGRVIWSLPTFTDVDPSSPALGDLDGDGWADVVVGGLGGTWAFRGRDGRELWEGEANTYQCGAISIADLDVDGVPEVVMGRSVLDGPTGTLRGRGEHGAGTGVTFGYVMAGIGVAADVDGGGDQEMVAGNAIYDADGSALWYNGLDDAFTAVADFDGDDAGEIVASGMGSVRLEDDDGTLLWEWASGDDRSGAPTVADFVRGGLPEIGVATHGAYTVLDATGAEVWTAPIDDPSSGIGVGVAFDFDGDGIVEVVIADEESVWVFSGRDGAVVYQETQHSSSTCGESVAVADVDGDGSAEIVYGSTPVFGPETGVTVIGSASSGWQPAREVWNQHAYAITNINDDGTIPSPADPNWPTYNSFRQAVSGTIPDAADLEPAFLDVCLDGCDEGDVTVWVSVANQGLVDAAGPIEVTVQGLTDAGLVDLGTTSVPGPFVAATSTDGVEIVLHGVPASLYDLSVTVDGPNVVDECDESNNAASWGPLVCP